MYNKILVPTDGSEHAVRAEEEAIYIAEKTGAELIGLSTVENNFVNGLPLNDEVYELNNLLKENTKNNVDKFEELVHEKQSLKLLKKKMWILLLLVVQVNLDLTDF